MTESEWLTCDDPQRMLREVIIDRPSTRPLCGRMASYRKLRLFCVACVPLFGLPPDHYGDDGERIMDPVGSAGEWSRQPPGGPSGAFTRKGAADILRDIIGNPYRPVAINPDWLNEDVARMAQAAYEERGTKECSTCSGTGYSWGSEWFCAVCNLRGKGATKGLIQTDHLDPVRLAMLVDALEEAGAIDPPGRTVHDVVRLRKTAGVRGGCCDRYAEQMACDCLAQAAPEGILAHLRSPGPHWRGCWAVDALTGRE